MPVALESVVKQLTDSGIIAPGKLENFIPPKATPKDGEELLRELYKKGLLTKFQAQQFAQGRDKALILGEYTIVDRIGAGGMGQVFKALHRRMDRTVAIKTLPTATMKDAAAVARFEREVKAAAKLRHPNVVAADDAGYANGVHFLVMEYVEGQDLSALVKKNGPFSVSRAVNYILQAAKGLEFAHRKGVVHRDIKPANLLLDTEGTVKILDMGLARLDHPGGDAATQAELTGTGAVMGTVDYMAPEQALNTKHADHRADIYSLGITLYYLIAGKCAYDGETLMEKLMGHQTKPIPSLKDVQANIPDSVQAIFAKMVAKKKEDRYQTMSEVIAELEKCQGGLSSSSPSATVKSSASSDTQESEMTAAFGSRRLQAIPAVERYEEPEKKAGLKLGRPALIGLVAAGLLGVVILAGIIVSLRTKDGTLIVEVDQPDAMVQVLDLEGKVEISQKGGIGRITIGVDPGKHRLKVEKDGFAVFGQEFELEKGGKKEITAKLEPVQLAAVVGESNTTATPPLAKAPFDAAQAKAHQAAWAKYLGTTVESKNSVGMSLVLIPPGEFLMGSSDEQIAAALKVTEEIKHGQTDNDRIQKSERSLHRVVITMPFLMSATEVTIGQFKKFVEATKYGTEAEQYGFGNSGEKTLSNRAKDADKGLNWKSPGYDVFDTSPVTQITWNDACAYCAWLGEQEQWTPWYRADGKGGWLIAAQANGYRLPTEAEWEYACRAGTTTQYSFGDDYTELVQYGWYKKNTNRKAQPVALKLPNPFGLFDMHGNLSEWCQDFYDDKWYEKSQSSDPQGPSSGTNRVSRGGGVGSTASYCRSAARHQFTPSDRHISNGFRIVRPLDAIADSRLATATTQPHQSWNTPAFQAWMKDVQGMPAEEQIKAVSKKLVELNPGFDGVLIGFDGKGTPKIDDNMVMELQLDTKNVINLSPLRALRGLKRLQCSGLGSKLSDLSPLQGLQLTTLACRYTAITDLSPLKTMPLDTLDFQGTPVADLSPLHDLPLTHLNCPVTKVADLSPLQGSNIANLYCSYNPISDLTPLQECKNLQYLVVTHTKVTPAGVAALQKTLPNCKIVWDDPAKTATTHPNQPWNTPAFQAWVKEVQAMPAEEQVKAVSKKLMELNPGFDGKVTGRYGSGTPSVKNGDVTDWGLFSDAVADISPLSALKNLKTLRCSGSREGKGKLSDLTPLQNLPLMLLEIQFNEVSDLSPLMNCQNLTWLDLRGTKVMAAAVDSLRQLLPRCDIKLDDPAKAATTQPTQPWNTPAFQAWVKEVQAMPAEEQIEAISKKLMELNPGFDGQFLSPPMIEKRKVTGIHFLTDQVTNLSPVRALTDLKLMKFSGSSPARRKLWDLSPLQGMSCNDLDFRNTLVSDLSPLTGMPLKNLTFGSGEVSDLSPLKGMPLTLVKCFNTQVSDLSPLKGMRLTELDCSDLPVSDLSPLQGMPIKYLNCLKTKVSNLSPLRGMPLLDLKCDDTAISDLSPLVGMSLTNLWVVGANVVDLSPVKGMPITELRCGRTQISDLSPLKGMPLTKLICDDTQVSDVSPLESCKNLALLNIHKTKVTPASVAALQKALPNCKIEWDEPVRERTK